LIEQQGQIVSVTGDRIRVRIGATSGCSACDAGRGCGAGVFGRLLRRKPVVMEFENSLDAKTGQPVVIGLQESLFLRLVVRLYLLPLLAGLLGAIVGKLAAEGLQLADSATDLAVLVAAIVFFAAVGFWIRSRPVEFPVDLAVHVLRIGQCEVLE
jgi:sigma-E factor negative regulatory protein RseC